MSTKINYEKKAISIADLKAAPQSKIYQLIKLSEPSVLSHYQNETQYFGHHYEMPVVTSNNVILSHREDVEAAFENKQDTLEVMVVSGLDEGDLMRFNLKTIFFKKLAKADRKKLCTLLEDYLRNDPYGIKWAEELKLNGHNDINEKLKAILNCSKDLIKLIKRTNENEVNLQASGKKKEFKNDIEFSFRDGVKVLKVNGQAYELNYDKVKITTSNGKLLIQVDLKDNGIDLG